MISGENGILKKVVHAKESTEKASVEEKVRIAIQSSLSSDYNEYGKITEETLIQELEKNGLVENEDNIKEGENGKWLLAKDDKIYEIYSDGELEIKQKNKLPDSYKELEYIENTGTQYIDTGIIPDENTKIITHIYRTIRNKTWQFPFGARNDAGVNEFAMCFYKDGGGWRDDYGNTPDRLFFDYTDETGSFYIEKNKNICEINGKIVNHSNSINIECNYTCTIFGINHKGIVVEGQNDMFKLYYFEMYNNDSLVRSFIPCKTTIQVVDVTGTTCPSGTIGLYDMVESKFYKNKGSGTFIPGPEIE